MISRRGFLGCGCATMFTKFDCAAALTPAAIEKLPSNVRLKNPLCQAGLSAEIYNGKDLLTVEAPVAKQFEQEWGLVATAMLSNPLLAFVQDSPEQMLISTYSFDQSSRPVVVFGLNSLSQVQGREEFAHEIMVGCLAHEFAHAIQYKSQCIVNLHDRGDSYRSGPCISNLKLERSNSPFMIELHADFLAGWVLGREGLLTTKNFQGFSRFLFSLGDTFFGTSLHHGTPRQRLNAMAAGWAFGNNGKVVGINTTGNLEHRRVATDHRTIKSAFDVGQVILADYLGGCISDECYF